MQMRQVAAQVLLAMPSLVLPREQLTQASNPPFLWFILKVHDGEETWERVCPACSPAH